MDGAVKFWDLRKSLNGYKSSFVKSIDLHEYDHNREKINLMEYPRIMKKPMLTAKVSTNDKGGIRGVSSITIDPTTRQRLLVSTTNGKYVINITILVVYLILLYINFFKLFLCYYCIDTIYFNLCFIPNQM